MVKNRGKIRRLAWIMDFLNQEIDGLKSGDFLKLYAEAEENIFSYLKRPAEVEIEEFLEPSEKKKPIKIEDTPITRGKIKMVQERMRNLLEKILAANKDPNPFTNPLPKGKPYQFPTFSPVLEFKKDFSFWAGHGLITLLEEKTDHDLEYFLGRLILDCSPRKDAHQEMGTLEHIKRCNAPGCRNYFLKIHKKSKNYCSNQCAWRAYSAFRREEERKDKAKQRGR